MADQLWFVTRTHTRRRSRLKLPPFESVNNCSYRQLSLVTRTCSSLSDIYTTGPDFITSPSVRRRKSIRASVGRCPSRQLTSAGHRRRRCLYTVCPPAFPAVLPVHYLSVIVARVNFATTQLSNVRCSILTVRRATVESLVRRQSGDTDDA